MVGSDVRRTLVMLASGLALIAAGCGSSVGDDTHEAADGAHPQDERDAQRRSDDGTPSAPSAPDRPSEANTPKRPDMPPMRPGPNPPETIAIDAARPVADGRTLRVRYLIGQRACDGSLNQAEVRETPRVVSITLHRDPPPGRGKVACILRLDAKTTDVRLDAPLGSRAVLDAPNHAKVPRRPAGR